MTRIYCFTSIAICLSLTLVTRVQGQDNAGTKPSRMLVENCVALTISDIDVPAQETGQLLEMFAKEGDAVQQDQLLAQLDDRVSQRMLEEAETKLESAKARAEDENEILAASARYQLTTEEYNKILSLAQRGSKSETEKRHAKYAMEASKYELARARTAKKIALLDQQTEAVRLAAARDSVERHKIESRIDGVVAERYREPGEWVTAGEKVFRILRMDRLRIQGLISASDVDPFEVAGRPVTVTATLARGRKVQFQGHITFVGVEKRGNNQYVIWAEVDNRMEQNYWMLQPGTEVEMIIHLDQPAVDSAQAPQLNHSAAPRR